MLGRNIVARIRSQVSSALSLSPLSSSCFHCYLFSSYRYLAMNYFLLNLSTTLYTPNFLTRMLSKLTVDKKPPRLRPLRLPAIVAQREAAEKAKQPGLWLRMLRASLQSWSHLKLVSPSVLVVLDVVC